MDGRYFIWIECDKKRKFLQVLDDWNRTRQLE